VIAFGNTTSCQSIRSRTPGSFALARRLQDITSYEIVNTAEVSTGQTPPDASLIWFELDSTNLTYLWEDGNPFSMFT